MQGEVLQYTVMGLLIGSALVASWGYNGIRDRLGLEGRGPNVAAEVFNNAFTDYLGTRHANAMILGAAGCSTALLFVLFLKSTGW